MDRKILEEAFERISRHVESGRNAVLIGEDYIKSNGKHYKLVTTDMGVEIGVNELNIMPPLECVTYLVDQQGNKEELKTYKTRAEAKRGHAQLKENLRDKTDGKQIIDIDPIALLPQIAALLPEGTDFFIIIDKQVPCDCGTIHKHEESHEVGCFGHINKKVLRKTIAKLIAELD